MVAAAARFDTWIVGTATGIVEVGVTTIVVFLVSAAFFLIAHP